MKFVVQSRDVRGNWIDYQAAWNFEEAKGIEAGINNNSPLDQNPRVKKTRIVAADKAENLYHL